MLRPEYIRSSISLIRRARQAVATEESAAVVSGVHCAKIVYLGATLKAIVEIRQGFELSRLPG
jgi:hypothetical protein